MAVSTFCKRCGEHFKLTPTQVKSGGLGAFFRSFRKSHTPSVLQPAFQRTENLSTPALRASKDENPYFVDAADQIVSRGANIEPFRRDRERADDVDEEGIIHLDNADESTAYHVNPKRRGEPGQRAVRCLDCEAMLYVSEHATSTLCHRCSAYVSLQDYEVKGERRENIRTRGDLIVWKKGALTASQIMCNNLKVYGQVSGKIDCAGNVFFRSSGKVMGSMRCKHLIVHKSCKLEFVPGIRAESVEIHGEVRGDIFCEGRIKITKTGAVYGDCTAPTVVLEDGGMLSGQMRFMKPDQELMAEYARKAQAVHDEMFDAEAEQGAA